MTSSDLFASNKKHSKWMCALLLSGATIWGGSAEGGGRLVSPVHRDSDDPEKIKEEDMPFELETSTDKEAEFFVHALETDGIQIAPALGQIRDELNANHTHNDKYALVEQSPFKLVLKSAKSLLEEGLKKNYFKLRPAEQNALQTLCKDRIEEIQSHHGQVDSAKTLNQLRMYYPIPFVIKSLDQIGDLYFESGDFVSALAFWREYEREAQVRLGKKMWKVRNAAQKEIERKRAWKDLGVSGVIAEEVRRGRVIVADPYRFFDHTYVLSTNPAGQLWFSVYNGFGQQINEVGLGYKLNQNERMYFNLPNAGEFIGKGWQVITPHIMAYKIKVTNEGKIIITTDVHKVETDLFGNVEKLTVFKKSKQNQEWLTAVNTMFVPGYQKIIAHHFHKSFGVVTNYIVSREIEALGKYKTDAEFIQDCVTIFDLLDNDLDKINFIESVNGAFRQRNQETLLLNSVLNLSNSEFQMIFLEQLGEGFFTEKELEQVGLIVEKLLYSHKEYTLRILHFLFNKQKKLHSIIEKRPELQSSLMQLYYDKNPEIQLLSLYFTSGVNKKNAAKNTEKKAVLQRLRTTERYFDFLEITLGAFPAETLRMLSDLSTEELVEDIGGVITDLDSYDVDNFFRELKRNPNIDFNKIIEVTLNGKKRALQRILFDYVDVCQLLEIDTEGVIQLTESTSNMSIEIKVKVLQFLRNENFIATNMDLYEWVYDLMLHDQGEEIRCVAAEIILNYVDSSEFDANQKTRIKVQDREAVLRFAIKNTLQKLRAYAVSDDVKQRASTMLIQLKGNR